MDEAVAEELDYKPPTVKGVVYRWKDKPSFDQCLCEVPDEIHILGTGQVIARYDVTTKGPLTLVDDPENPGQKMLGFATMRVPSPDLPYEDLDDLLEEHCQGVLKPNDLRARLQDQPAADVFYTRAKLEDIKKNAQKFYGDFAVKFVPRLVG